MQRWDLEETRTYVMSKYGHSQLELLRPCMNSIIDRQAFATYHFQEYKRLLHENIDSKLADKSILELTFPLTAERKKEIDELQVKLGAHVVACIQSLHSLADMLAHVVCYAYGLNLRTPPLKERDISIKSVLAAIQQEGDLSGVHQALKNICTHADFQYLEALANQSKHRSIVEPDIHVDGRDGANWPYKIMFPMFSYCGRVFDSRDAELFMESVYSWLSICIVDCGIALNRSLRNDSRDA